MAKTNGKTPQPNLGEPTRLGDYVISRFQFEDLDKVFKEFQAAEFKKLTEMQKSEQIGRNLLKLIQNASEPCFLLGAILDYIDRVNREKIIGSYAFYKFELWLNQYSGLSVEENYKVRAHIAGKYIPREEYQVYFPIGMGKRYAGSHFVTAHSSPDLDTTVASFWGWMDAFAARVSEGMHVWNVPGGTPPAQIEIRILFNDVFGEEIFQNLAKTRSSLTVSGLDLMTQKGVSKKQVHESSLTIEHERSHSAVILIDKLGFYLGDWRSVDVEGVGQVIIMLSQTLRWFESHLHVELISLFAKEKLSSKDLDPFFRSVFKITMEEAPPVKRLSDKQRERLEKYLVKVLKVASGLKCTFEEFAIAMKALSLADFQEFMDLVASLQKSSLFDKAGYLLENRPPIFLYLEKIIRALDNAILNIGKYVETLDVAHKIKTEVFGHKPHFLNYHADLEEVRNKIGPYSYLTVTSEDEDGRLIPMGVIYASELIKQTLGTVTLRDFSNRDETKIPAYLEVISIIDHHKSSIHTFSAPMALISDAQSSNTLVAMLAFRINDAYSTGGMTLTQIQAQMKEVEKDLGQPKNMRIMQRLLQRYLVCEKKKGYFIDKQREIIEYMHFLFAIFDDTDLLTKVSLRDVECVANLLNRLKSLIIGKEVEIISFDDLPHDEKFVSAAANRILQDQDTYSLYQKIYAGKEDAINQNLKFCVAGQPSTLFSDTKEQNGCCRVGQTKLFLKNISTFEKHADRIRAVWYEEAVKVHREKSEIDLHLHMLSTISGAEDLFAGNSTNDHKHKDELWIWIPNTQLASEHLKSFLGAFRGLPLLKNQELEVEFLGDNAQLFERIFKESFAPIPMKHAKKASLPIAVLRFKAGLINSRKAVISPCLPQLVS